MSVIPNIEKLFFSPNFMIANYLDFFKTLMKKLNLSPF